MFESGTEFKLWHSELASELVLVQRKILKADVSQIKKLETQKINTTNVALIIDTYRNLKETYLKKIRYTSITNYIDITSF